MYSKLKTRIIEYYASLMDKIYQRADELLADKRLKNYRHRILNERDVYRARIRSIEQSNLETLNSLVKEHVLITLDKKTDDQNVDVEALWENYVPEFCFLVEKSDIPNLEFKDKLLEMFGFLVVVRGKYVREEKQVKYKELLKHFTNKDSLNEEIPRDLRNFFIIDEVFCLLRS
jgi:hypothetical protein